MRISLRSVFQHNFQHLIPFVTFRMPDAAGPNTWIQDSDTLYSPKEVRNRKHFLFSPFEIKSRFPSIALLADKAFQGWDIPDPYRIFASSNHQLVPELRPYELPEQEKSDYLHAIHLLKSEISQDPELHKVVLSRPVKKEYGREINPFALFKQLSLSYPKAFVYCFFHPLIGLWLGASPETFLKAHHGELSTMSLAGTQVNGHPFSDKELKEQAFVTDFIIKTLDHHKAKNIRWSEPIKQKAGPVTHLKTEIQATLNGHNPLQHLIDSLHPTPAVCGQPKYKSMALIKKLEAYERSYYTGYLGPVHGEDSLDLYVNLRCMQLFKDAAALYVGGGITLESVPEDEWQETEAKSRTLLTVMESLMHQYA